MKVQNSPLFRQEALRHRTDRLHGDVSIATPMAWQVIGFLLLTVLAATIIFLCIAKYSRTETVPGQITLDRGVAMIVPSRAGVVLAMDVSEGERVRAGQKLATIRAEENLIGGATAPDRIREALDKQDAGLAEHSNLLMRAADADQSRLKAQIEGDLAAIPALEAQITDQKQLIATAESDYNNALEVAKRGYVSKRDLEAREATVLTRRQQLAELEQSLTAKNSQITQARRAIIQSDMTARAQVADTRSDRAALLQQQTQADLARGYSVISPIDGTVTALTAQLGQHATTDQQLMLVVPAHARPRVELFVPTTASGFLALEQEVRLSVDAFPYQTFGTVEAKIIRISKAAITRQGHDGPVSVYLVTASIPHPWIKAFGRKQPLLPGMTLSARIITERRSLIEWLFEPLFAVINR